MDENNIWLFLLVLVLGMGVLIFIWREIFRTVNSIRDKGKLIKKLQKEREVLFGEEGE